MRTWRQVHRLTPEQAHRADVRSRTRKLIARGVITRGPCVRCGILTGVEAHHPSYTSARCVVFFCREHHLAHHQLKTRLAASA
jgi:hypothetical protein